MISAELKVFGGKHAGQIIPLNRRKFLIGREQDCQLRPNSEMVSRHHCVFSMDDFSVRLRDLGSTNGTLVNGERIRKETVLADGDRILIGNLDFLLAIRAGVMVPDSDSTVVPTAIVAAIDTQVTTPGLPVSPAIGSPTAVASDTTVTMPITVPDVPAPSVVAAQTPAFGAMDQSGALMPGMMPGQYPYQPMMSPMGYPGGMYGGYPYQPQMMPGYGQVYNPMMAPMMAPMGYQVQPGMGAMPTPAAPSPQVPAAPAESPVGVSLPDPSTTGAKDAEAAKGSSGSNTKDTAKPTGAADAIIKQYLGRRPGG